MVSTPNETIEKIDYKVCEQAVECIYYGSDNQFVNPTVEEPVRVQEIMKRLDLEFLKPTLNELYKEAWRFHFNPLSVLKTMIYWRLKGHRFLTDVFNDLLTDSTLADTLGFGFIPAIPIMISFSFEILRSEKILS